MKIAILHTSLDVKGGAEKQVLNLAKELKNFGHEVTIYVSKIDKDKCYPELMDELKIVECGGFGYKHHRLSILLSPIYMYLMSKKIENCDIINCHNYPTIYAAVLAKKRKNIPIIWMCNEPPFPPLFAEKNNLSKIVYKIMVSPFLLLNKICVKKIDDIVVLDNLNERRINTAYNRGSKIIYTGLDFPKDQLSVNKENSYRLLSVGRIDKGKRIEDLISAMDILKKDIPRIKLDIVGRGKELDAMKSLSTKLNLDENVTFHGAVDDKTLSELYDSCDIFVFTAENQSWGLVPLEAMAHNKPCLISTGCGVSEILNEGETCLKIRPREVQDIVNKTKLLLDNPTLHQKIAENGKQFVYENFSWKKYAKQMEKIFLN